MAARPSSRPRSLEEIERLATYRSVIYRLAIIDALRALDERSCASCRAAAYILESVDLPRPDAAPATVPPPAEPEDPAPKPMTAFDVSCLFNVAPNTIKRWAEEGRLPSYTDNQGHLRFDPHLIDAELDRRS